MSERVNRVASPAEFRALAEKSAWSEPERIVLPGSGFAIVLRRPTLMYFRLRRSAYPKDLLDKMEFQGVGGKPELTAEEKLFLLNEEYSLIMGAFVSPRLSLTPEPEEIDPNWLSPEDATFIFSYLRGEVLADGTDLETFRGKQPGPAGDSGGAGGEVRTTSGGDAGEPDGGVVH